MQRVTIQRVLSVATLLLVGGQVGPVIAADTVALLLHRTGDEAYRGQHDSTTDSTTNGPQAEIDLFDVQWPADASAVTVRSGVKKKARSRRGVVAEVVMKIVRPIPLPTVFSVPVELDLFGIAKYRNPRAIVIHPRMQGKKFKLSLSCPL